ncbi:hypothetical protein ACFVWR_09640 [Leifsonia sp. NPDC058292]|uniref:hypothetical protein n=1 Tax=Leifsonia sp. NPDC058292 TaxID=3346428 RepID=UPI0036DD590C
MSTVDPTIARKLRESRRPSTARVVTVLLLLLLGGLLAGYGWGSTGRLMDEAVVAPDATAIIAIPIGMLVSIVSSIAWAAIVMKRSDLGMMYGTAATLLGAGAGVLLASRGYADATPVVVIGSGILALAVVCLVLGVAAAAARARKARAEDAAMRTGTLATGTVSDKGYTVFRESSRILTTVTFTFTDVHGVQRWVQRTMTINAADPVENGQETRLWYDAANPGNDRAIVVELAHRSPLRAP